jgi:hypothetical protein
MFFWSIGTYRSETWTMGVREVRRLSYINWFTIFGYLKKY